MTDWAARLGLGGAQFGLDYGITNASGQLPLPEVREILRNAAAAGVGFLDTAPAYGASESAIGSTGSAAAFKMITKTQKLAADAGGENAESLTARALERSLSQLRVDCVDSVLVHDANDLTGSSGDGVWKALDRARREGRTRRIGVSVYNSRQLDALLDRFPIDIVQLPMNILDRRLERDGYLERMSAAGIAIHARSLFLQGLLLADPYDIPARFGPLRDAVGDLRSWARDRGVTVLQAALQYPLAHPHIECAVIGVTSAQELEAALAAAAQVAAAEHGDIFTSERELGERHLDPSRWSELR